MTDALAGSLLKLDACAVSDALDALGLPGAVAGLVPLTARRRIAGRVVTVELQPAGRDAPARHLGAAAVDAAQQGDIIVVANGGRTAMAGWGGLLSLGATQRGVAGVVVDGACRDVDEAADLDLPLYARSAVPVTARGRVVEAAWGGEVEVGGITVAAGDFVIADSSGVVFVAAANAAAVVERAEVISARERAIGEAIRAGRSMSEAMGADYETMLDAGRAG